MGVSARKPMRQPFGLIGSTMIPAGRARRSRDLRSTVPFGRRFPSMSKLSTLLEMLTYCRPAGSGAESAFVARFVATLPGATCDPFGNWHVIIGTSPILWSCHTDTVHTTSGRQTVHVTADGVVGLSRRSRHMSSCLGADDTAGVWLCHQLILAGVPGHYIFHYGEEIGGEGSSELARYPGDTFAGFKYAIALDRRGTGDVITHQFARCCSDTFAESLAAALNLSGLDYSPDSTGVFTDTANYTDLIGECTNLSVGYQHAHSERETLDTAFLSRLFAALCTLDPASLVSERLPGEMSSDYGGYAYVGDWSSTGTSAGPIVWAPEDMCQWCGSEYYPDESDARDVMHYCDRACEGFAIEAARADARGPYLDPSYAQVQAALRGELSPIVVDRSSWPRL